MCKDVADTETAEAAEVGGSARREAHNVIV